MNEKRVVVAIVCALAAAVPVAASAAGDRLAQVRADVAKLTADAETAKSTVTADGQSGDVAQLRRDAKAGNATVKADWKLLVTDVTAARKAGADEAALRSLLQAAHSQVKEFHSVVRAAAARARQSAKQKKGPHGSTGKGKPSGRESDDDGSGR